MHNRNKEPIEVEVLDSIEDVLDDEKDREIKHLKKFLSEAETQLAERYQELEDCHQQIEWLDAERERLIKENAKLETNLKLVDLGRDEEMIRQQIVAYTELSEEHATLKKALQSAENEKERRGKIIRTTQKYLDETVGRRPEEQEGNK